jgi:hypothetical protein
LTSVIPGDEWSVSSLGHVVPSEIAHGSHWIGGRVGLRRSLVDVEKRKL